MNLIRTHLRELQPYVPGEQPREPQLIKLNTNENPYPPSPRVLRAIRAAVDGRLRLYPNPTAQTLREKLARRNGCDPANIVIGNGSDELLALASRTFVEPRLASSNDSSETGYELARRTIQFFTPSYSLYPVLASIHGAIPNAVPLQADFGWGSVAALRRRGRWNFHAALSYVTTPNAPSGRGYSKSELAALCRAQRGVVVLDEAYADFAEENALALALQFPHVLVARTFSKSYSLCFLRVGYMVGPPKLIAALDKVRDSYNVNGLGQVAALTSLADMKYHRANIKKIKRTRAKVADALASLGFEVLPSAANFLFVKPPQFSARDWLDKLRARKVLVRWFGGSRVRDYLRVTIGSDREMAMFLRAVENIMAGD